MLFRTTDTYIGLPPSISMGYPIGTLDLKSPNSDFCIFAPKSICPPIFFISIRNSLVFLIAQGRHLGVTLDFSHPPSNPHPTHLHKLWIPCRNTPTLTIPPRLHQCYWCEPPRPHAPSTATDSCVDSPFLSFSQCNLFSARQPQYPFKCKPDYFLHKILQKHLLAIRIKP